MEHSLLHNEQNEFHNNRSCTDHLYSLISIIDTRKKGVVFSPLHVSLMSARHMIENQGLSCMSNYEILALIGEIFQAIQTINHDYKCCV